MTRVRVGFVLGLLCALIAPLAALEPPQGGLEYLEVRDPALNFRNIYVPVASLPLALSQQVHHNLLQLGVDPGNAYFDRRSGTLGTLILTRPLVPGPGVGNHLEWETFGYSEAPDSGRLEAAVWRAFRDFLREQNAQFGFDEREFDKPTVTAQNQRLVRVYLPRRVGDIRVRDSFVNAVVNSGNLVLMGSRNWAPVDVSLTPSLGATTAEAVLLRHLGNLPYDGLRNPARLELVPTSNQAREEGVEIGRGTQFRLAWVLEPVLRGDLGDWEALVDAHSGELLLVADRNHYASRAVKGGVYPVSNDGQGDDGTEQPEYPMPYADVAIDGTPMGFTTTGGNAPAGTDSGTLSTQLDGQYVRMNDNCGAINESSPAGDLDLEQGPGTDCAIPSGHSAGNTHSSRTGFYELNRIKEQGRGYLPSNTWLQGKLTSNMNINNQCNAFWSTGLGTVNFYRSGGGCANTGEIAAVFDHEWGHGMDANDATPGVSRPGEGIADLYAIYRLNDSCVGRNFRPGVNCDGFGDLCLDCTGVRETDWAKHASGEPHDVAWILSPTSGPGGGCGAPGIPGSTPCGGGTHCEGHVVSESGWDLVHRDLQGFEGSDFDYDLNTALELGTRLAYEGSGGVTSWYQCVTDGTGGCNSDSGYLNFLAADDDNGDLTDGTPHMTALFAAFDRHQIACPAPTVQNGGCTTPPAVPDNLDVDTFDEGVSLTWDPVAGASEYWIYRTEGVHGCDFGKVRVGTTTAPSFSESGLRNGMEVFYSVIAATTGGACASEMSACASAIPSAGPSGRIAGTVTDRDSGAPVAGAVVAATGPVSLSANSNGSGEYQIFGPVGTYDVTVTADGYDEATFDGIEIVDGEITALDVELRSTPAPVAAVSPTGLTLVAPAGDDAEADLAIENHGTLPLTWTLDTDAPDLEGRVASHDPSLDEAFALPDFSVDSLPNGGTVVSFEVEGGDLTRGMVVGVRFLGTVSGIQSSSSWASDLCMKVTSPDGATFTVGGFTGNSQPDCTANTWEFDGGGSTNDGTYTSTHDDVFAALEDTGTWTFAFSNDWNSSSAATMNWSDVLVTLLKEPLPICDDITSVPWLTVTPAAGTTPPLGESEVEVVADSAGLAPGEHLAGVCVASNDADRPVIGVPVTFIVAPAVEPLPIVDPGELFFSVPSGGNDEDDFDIDNDGGAALDWTLTEAPSNCNAPADVTWLAVSSTSGSIPAGDDDRIDVTVDASALADGTYSAVLCLDSNSPSVPRVVIPVTLEAGAPATFEAVTLAVADGGNGVLEAGETAVLATVWSNEGFQDGAASGIAVDLEGPGDGGYTLVDDSADYGTVAAQSEASCSDTGDCFEVAIGEPSSRPALHWDASFFENLSDGTRAFWPLHIGESFGDVASGSPFYPSIEAVLHHGVTSGCGDGNYCPATTVNRAQMATFLLSALEGPGYGAPACASGSEIFPDVPATHPHCPSIEELSRRGVTGGCGGGNYCPGNPVNRAQMAVFLLVTLEGDDYSPPACTGVFGDVACPSPFADWIEELYERGITGGCSTSPLNYCPGNAVQRQQMAVFLATNFGLTLYGQ